jgi:hypothetical protein
MRKRRRGDERPAHDLGEEREEAAAPGCLFAPNRAADGDDSRRVASRYYGQRHRLFSRFDSGVWMTRSMFYSVTMEAIAADVARRHVEAAVESASALRCIHIAVDVFCGAGGNLIQLALARTASREPLFFYDLVVGIDVSREVLTAASTNCSVYGIARGRVLLMQGDVRAPGVVRDALNQAAQVCSQRAPGCGGEIVVSMHMSPPWGGEEYSQRVVFDVERDLRPLPMSLLLRHVWQQVRSFGACSDRGVSIATWSVFLPKNVCLDDVARAWAWALAAVCLADTTAGPVVGRLRLATVRHVVNSRLKGITAFAGLTTPAGVAADEAR